MNQKFYENQLRKEGFKTIYVWQDGPNAYYPDHTHAEITAHIILEGEMEVTMKGKTDKYKPGDRFDVSANTVHNAKMGKTGCKYLIGEK